MANRSWFHGTIKEFSEFDTSDKKLKDSKNPLGDNIGAFFSSKKHVAHDFAQRGKSDQERTAWQLKYLNGPCIGSKIHSEDEAIEALKDMGVDEFETIEVTAHIPAIEFDSIVIEASIDLANPMVFKTYTEFKAFVIDNERSVIEALGHDGVFIEDSEYDNDQWMISFNSSKINEIGRTIYKAGTDIALPVKAKSNSAFIEKAQKELIKSVDFGC